MPTPPPRFRLETLTDPATLPVIAAFLEEHLADMRRTSPPDSVHALDLQRLRQPGIRFWTAWSPEDGSLLATGAIQVLDATQGELKSMRSAAALRGRGLGRAMLTHLLDDARRLGLKRLSLETGTGPFFEPAHALYRSQGFVACPPFADYRLDPFSHYMTRRIDPSG